MNSITVLVTGAGGDIGISVAKCLKDSMPQARLIGADCRSDTAAPAFFEKTALLPIASDPGYLQKLQEVAHRERVDIMMPLSEAELSTLLAADLIGGSVADAKIISASRRVLEVGLDKFETYRRLRAANIAAPETGLVGVDEPGDYSLIIKPRRGQGSKGIERIARNEYGDCEATRRGDVWQRYISDEGGEYTCGVTRFPAQDTRVIVFRRTLCGGFTGSGDLVRLPTIDKACRAIAEALDLRGAMNVQLRLENDLPMIFEINARFSSTVRFRHLLGFTDVVWSVQDRLGLPVGAYEPVEEGARILRVSDEIILPAN